MQNEGEDIARLESLLGLVLSQSAQVKTEDELQPLRDSLAQARDLIARETDLVAYEQRRLKELLSSAEQSVDTAYLRIKPRRKFRFRSAQQVVKESQVEKEVAKVEVRHMLRPPQGIDIRQEDIKDGELVLRKVEGKDVSVEDLKDAKITLWDVAGAMRITNVQNVTLQVAAVSGSVLLRRAKGCTFYIACRQVRVHDCTDCTFWLHSASGPIVERCEGVRFGRGVFGTASRVGLKENLWDQVKDFSDLRGQSDGWMVIRDRFVTSVGEDIMEEYV